MLTTSQIKWAAQHDWFITEHYIVPGTIVVRDDEVKEGFLKFNGFKKLKEWAGY